MLESPPVGTDTAVTTGDRAALLEVENTELRARIEAREQRIRLLEEALRVLKANTYGPSRERLSVAAGQVELFNEIEATLEITEAVGIEPELKATPLREEKPAGGKPGRTKLASHLPRVEIRHELTEAERQCDCGGVLAEIGADVSEQLDYVPAKVQVLRHVRVKYACPGCEQCVKTRGAPRAHPAEDQCLPGAARASGDQQVRRLPAAVSSGGDVRALRSAITSGDPGGLDDRPYPTAAAAVELDGRATAILRLRAHR